MRRALLHATFLAIAVGCSGPAETGLEQFEYPNAVLRNEIANRLELIPIQREAESDLTAAWFVARGEQALPQLLESLDHANPKVRALAAWALGRIRDPRTVPFLARHLGDPHPVVEMELAFALLNLGDDAGVPVIIAGLANENQNCRYHCHEALRSWSGMDFGYDHKVQTPAEREPLVRRWMVWWNDRTKKPVFPVGPDPAAFAAPPAGGR